MTLVVEYQYWVYEISIFFLKVTRLKVNSVQEACAKCFAVHLLKFEILQTTWKNKTKNIKMLNLLVKNWKVRVWWPLFHFFHVFCKISNFHMWTVKHLVQASCTELTLKEKKIRLKSYSPTVTHDKIFGYHFCVL